MANICSNSYRFVFSDGEKAKKFLNFVNTSDQNSVYDMGIKAGIKNAEGRDVRQWVEGAYIRSPVDPHEIGVATESKWTACPNAWEDIS